MGHEDWDDSYDEEWAREVAGWAWDREGNVMRVEGECPRCGHPMSREVERASTLRSLTAEPPEESAPSTVMVTIRCNCTGSHPRRPKRFLNGCGRSVRVELPLYA